MFLFKAIKFDGDNSLNSSFNGRYKYDSSVMELIEAAMGHIKVANQKRTKRDSDYWISATYDFNTALRYLNEHKDGVYGYTGIACIELPNTHLSGYIFDHKLREEGYLDKRCTNESVELICTPNADGVIWLLDMSNEFTVNYLSSLLWLKGNDSTFRDLRVLRTSAKDNEILLLANNIEFKYIDIDTANRESYRLSKLNGKLRCWHEELYALFMNYAPESELKDKLVSLELKDYFDEYDYFGEKIDIKNDRVREFYKIIEGSYSKKNAIRRFTEYHTLDYSDKDTIEFEKYEPILYKTCIDYNEILTAYLHSCFNIYGVMKENDRFTVLAHLYKNDYIELFNKELLNYMEYFLPDRFQFGKFSDSDL